MKRVLSILSIFALSAILASCNSLNDQETAKVTIDTGLRASKAAAPSDITAISVTVSGEGMATITKSIPLDTGISSFEVPVGSSRLFLVEALAGNFTYKGSATYNVVEETELNISITMIKQAGNLILSVPGYTGTVESFTVTVTIPETGATIEEIITPSDTIYMDVPPGNNREISVSATPLSQSAVLSFSTDTSTADFTHGQDTAVSLFPAVSETKIVIPDYYNQRIVQIDDMDCNGWTAITGFSSGYIGTLYPYDIDFDAQGRIYCANSGGGTGQGVVIRVDNMSLTDCETLGTNSLAGDQYRQAITIDRSNHILYYSNGNDNNVYIQNLLTGEDTAYFENPAAKEGNIIGLAIDAEGFLYISSGSDGNHLTKYNTNTESIEAYVTDDEADTDNYASWIGSPWDIIIKSDIVYAADVANAQIVRLDNNLAYLANLTMSPSEIYNFNGPHRFVAILNSRFYIIDDDGNTQSQLVSFDDFDDEWKVYSVHGTGDNAFKFWAFC